MPLTQSQWPIFLCRDWGEKQQWTPPSYRGPEPSSKGGDPRQSATATASNPSTGRCICWRPSPKPAARRRSPIFRPRTGLNISTCHHLLATLIKRGFAAKVPGRRLYALGARIHYLSHACLQVDLPRRAQPYMETINRTTGETVHLAALQGDAVVTLAVRDARHAGARRHRQDRQAWKRRTPPRSAKPILAWLPEDEMQRMLSDGMKRFTDNTITDFPAFVESLRVVRRNGYAIDREEYLPGVICVGAAIRDQAGTVIGAISASTPTMRATDEHIALMRDEITAATRALSAEFGDTARAAERQAPAAAD